MRSRLIIGGLGLAVCAFGQAPVRFSNTSADLSSPPDRLVRFAPGTANPFGTNNAPVVNWGTASYRAQLYYGASTASEQSLIPVTSAPALFRSSTTTIEPGTWGPGNRTLVGFDAGVVVNLQVRVWDSQYGSTYESALASGQGYLGTSAIFSYFFPSDPITPPNLGAMLGFVGFSIGTIPEPAEWSLVILGAAGLLLFRRGK